MSKFRMNPKLLPIKVHYFLICGAVAGVFPILPVHAKQLGISPILLGLVYTITRFFMILAKPAFGAIVDKFKNHKCMLISLSICVMITLSGIGFISPPNSDVFSCSNHTSRFTLLSRSHGACVWNCTNSTAMDKNITMVENEKDLKECFENRRDVFVLNTTSMPLPGNCSGFYDSYQCEFNCLEHASDARDSSTLTPHFYAFAVLLIVGWVLYSVTTTLSDAACYYVLQNRMHLFGNQRMFGSLGWMVISILSGILNYFFTNQYSLSYAKGFYLLIALMVIDLLVIARLDLQDVQTSKALFKDVRKLIFKPRILCFLISALLNGAFMGLVWSFLFLHLALMGADPLLLGITSTTQCIMEIPFFMFSGIIINKIGHLNTISIASVAFAVRFIGYSYLSNPWWTLPIEFLQGPAFAGFYSASTAYAKFIAPKGTAATMQGLVGATFEGLGVGVGSLLGGLGFGYFGGKKTFFWASVVALATGAIHFIVHKVLDFRENSKRMRTLPITVLSAIETGIEERNSAQPS